MYFTLKCTFSPLFFPFKQSSILWLSFPQKRKSTGTSARCPRLRSPSPARCLARGTACSAIGRAGPPAPRPAPARPSRASRRGRAPSWPTTPGKVSLTCRRPPPHPPQHQAWKWMQMRLGYRLSHGLSRRPSLSLTRCLDFTPVCVCIHLRQSAYHSCRLFLSLRLLARHFFLLFFIFFYLSPWSFHVFPFVISATHLPASYLCVCVCVCISSRSHSDGCGLDHSDGG